MQLRADNVIVERGKMNEIIWESDITVGILDADRSDYSLSDPIAGAV